ncbi:hypothetical protein LJB42_002531 [Komagataella kurtzmanii]|nr:hypothetical protein LJB42_002531 [Komagataella kurtzmanii]
MGLADDLVSDFSDDEELNSELITGSKGGLLNGGLSLHDLVNRQDLLEINLVSGLSQVKPEVEKAIHKIGEFIDKPVDKVLERDFLSKCNEILDKIMEEVVIFHTFVRIHYHSVFPELEALITDPVQYCQVVKIIGYTVSKSSKLEEELRRYLPQDKVLVVSMSASLQAQKNTQSLQEKEMQVIEEACDVVQTFVQDRQSILGYVISRVQVFAPNVTALVGPSVASQLIAVHGVLGLSRTPSCNIPSLGSKSGDPGYLYHCDLVQQVYPDFRKQALRIVAGKVILAARVDVTTGEDYSGSFGLKWRNEVTEKLEKIQAPPENGPTKALPIPIDQSSKKRGGRRIRKLKKQFEMSELRKAQNKMEFGTQEESTIDAFGEEIGLGLAAKNSQLGKIRSIGSVGTNQAKMSKSMLARLKNKQGELNNLSEELVFNNPEVLEQKRSLEKSQK